MTDLDSAKRVFEVRKILKKKVFLNKLYREIYAQYATCLNKIEPGGIALELGSGAGFAKEIVPELTTSDVIAYDGIDLVVDATKLPYGPGELRAVMMFDVFHHIPDVALFFQECQRCLKPGGRILIIDEYAGWLSTFIYKYLHHEAFDNKTEDWKFESTGPVSGANGALAWLVFERDLEKFKKLYPKLNLLSYRPSTPFRYILSGGLKSWSIGTGWSFPFFTFVDNFLIKIAPKLGYLVSIEIIRTH